MLPCSTALLLLFLRLPPILHKQIMLLHTHTLLLFLSNHTKTLQIPLLILVDQMPITNDEVFALIKGIEYLLKPIVCIERRIRESRRGRRKGNCTSNCIERPKQKKNCICSQHR